MHSKLSPSAASRWLICPGSIRLCEGMPEKKSPYADEGTAAHKLAELALQYSKSVNDISVVALKDGSLYTVTDEMRQAVQVYLNYVLQFKFKSVLMVEQHVDLSEIAPGTKGTCDAIAWFGKGKQLKVIDYKHGQGVAVSPENNAQLMLYAYGALLELQGRSFLDLVSAKNLEIELVIVQPRADAENPIKTWKTSTLEILTWVNHTVKPGAQKALSINAPLSAGTHCRFCRAIAICPEQAKSAALVAKTDFANPVLPKPETLNAQEIARVLEVSERFSNWAGEVMQYAQSRMELGIKIPGFKLVAKKSNRVWKDEKRAEAYLMSKLNEDAFEKKLLSPAKAEKVLKEDISSLIEKPDNGVVIAPESDRRKEVNAPALADFINDQAFLQ